MSVTVDPRIPARPVEAAYYVGRSLRSLQPTASALVHCLGWRFRPVTQAFWTYEAAVPTEYAVTPEGTSGTRRMRFRVTPLAQHLFVAFTHQAADDTSGPCEVELNLYDSSGVLQDGPVTFDAVAGDLPTASLDMFWFDEWPLLQADTGTATRETGADSIRMLNVPSGVRGEVVELRFTCTSVRLHSAMVWEWPEATL